MSFRPSVLKRRVPLSVRVAAARLISERGRDAVDEAVASMGSEVSDAVAADREACRSLATFVRLSWHAIEPDTPYLSNWHIDAICEHLEAVTRGEITRLLINIPPRYMKSITCSVMWPVWEWTFRPEVRYMFATYAGDLSKDHSDQRRAILGSDWFKERWGASVRVTKDDVLTVRNHRRGVFQATSFSGTATGKGANRLVVDDPHNPKKAESEVERVQTVKDFDRTFSNRLNNKKRDAILTVMQRLHEEDVAARCIELGYVHLCLPAEAEGRTVIVFPSGREVVREDGDLLWPDREGPAEIKAAQAAMGPYAYAGQYQQRPAPEGGGMFKSFPIVGAVPKGCTYVRYWDKAGTEGGGCYTAGVLMARTPTTAHDPDGSYYITHIVRGQWSASNREKVIRDTAAVDGPHVHIWVEREGGSGGKESAENTVRMLGGYTCQIDLVTGDKATRAQPMAAQSQIENVFLLRGEWNHAFLDEARMFPAGKYKDQVDAASGAFNKLALAARPAQGHAAGVMMPAPVQQVVRPPAGIPDALAGGGF